MQDTNHERRFRRHSLLRLAALLLMTAAAAYGVYGWRQRAENRRELVLQGNVDIREVELGFRVSGRIDQMRFEEGDAVKEGEVLAVLDKAPFNADLAAAGAAVSQAQATLSNAEILLARQKKQRGCTR